MDKRHHYRLIGIILISLIAGAVGGCTTRELLFSSTGAGLLGTIVYREHSNRAVGNHPDLPSMRSITSPTSSSLQIRWEENQNPDFSAYLLYRHTSSNVSTTTGTLVSTVTDRSTIQYLDENLQQYTRYYYVLYVQNVAGTTVASNRMDYVTGNVENRFDSGNTLITDARGGNVIEINSSGQTVWEITGLSGPYSARRLISGNTLICEADYFDTGTGSVKEYTADKEVTWQVGGLTKPTSATRLDNGNILITESADAPDGRVLEVDQNGSIVWSKTGLDEPMEAVRLENGNTLVTLHGSGKVVELDASGTTIWSRVGLSAPADARRTSTGTTWIAVGGEGRVIEVTTTGDVIREITGISYPRSVEILDNSSILVSDGRDTVWEYDSTGKATWWYTGSLDVPSDADRL